jgi:hypothetical protein
MLALAKAAKLLPNVKVLLFDAVVSAVAADGRKNTGTREACNQWTWRSNFSVLRLGSLTCLKTQADGSRWSVSLAVSPSLPFLASSW